MNRRQCTVSPQGGAGTCTSCTADEPFPFVSCGLLSSVRTTLQQHVSSRANAVLLSKRLVVVQLSVRFVCENIKNKQIKLPAIERNEDAPILIAIQTHDKVCRVGMRGAIEHLNQRMRDIVSIYALTRHVDMRQLP